MPGGQTIVQYGSATLFNCVTRRVEQRPVLDSAGVALKCWKFVIVVTGYLNGIPGGKIPYSSPADTNAAMTHKRFRWKLAPRLPFQMAVGCVNADIATGTTILYANPLNGVSQSSLTSTGLTGYDVDDGPRCMQFDVTQVSSKNVFKVEATFEIHRVQCTDSDTAAENTTGVLAHRWACADSIDVNNRTVRSYHGILELATSYWSPHQFRSLVVPPIQLGMRREHMEFVASEDGKKLQYTVTDVEVAVSAPYPAKTWGIEHTVTSLNGDSLKITEQVAVNLTGDHDVDKGQLIILGLYTISAKVLGTPPLPGNDPEAVGGVFFNDMTITDLTGDLNVIRVSASCWRWAREAKVKDRDGNDKQVSLASRYGAFKLISLNDLPWFVTQYDPNRSSGGYPRDNLQYDGPVSLTGIFRCYLQSPCNSTHGLNNTTKDSDGNVTGTNQLTTDNNPNPSNYPQATVDAVIAPSIPDNFPSYYSQSHKTSMYTYFEMESKYVDRTLRAACPIARSAYTGTGVDTRDGTAFPKIGPTQTYRVVSIVAERIGDWPEFPNAETMDYGLATTYSNLYSPIRQFLLSCKRLMKTVTTSINGEKLFSARFRAVYGLSRSPQPEEMLKVGVNKWQTDGATATTPTLTNSLQEDPAADTNKIVPYLGSDPALNPSYQ